MSRAQQGQVDSTASAENSTYNTDAQKSLDQTQGDITSYADEVGAFKAANPYVQGGTVQTADNQVTADTAAGMGESAGQALQGAAVRGGQNPNAAIAATKNMEQSNERALVGQEAQQNQSLADKNASYQSEVVGDTAKTASMEDTLGQQQGQLAQGALGTEEQAAQTPSFMDELGNATIQAGTQFASKIPFPCWIAAELYGGWYEPRTVLVRCWIVGPFRQTWYGALAYRAYMRWGERVATTIQTRRRLRAGFMWLFERARKAAEKAVNDGR